MSADVALAGVVAAGVAAGVSGAREGVAGGVTDGVTRVFVVAPTPLARAGLRSLLEGEVVSVVGEDSGFAGFEVGDPGADAVVVADEGLLEEAARAVSEGGGGLVLLSRDGQAVRDLNALSPDGWAVVSPDAPPAELSAAAVAAARGLVVLSRSLAESFVEAPEPEEPERDEPPAEPLTARELEVLDLLSQGLSNKQIARELVISEHTVKFHVSGIYARLGAANRAEAVNLGARLGLISL